MAAITRAERNINWIEHYCKIPDGKDVGKPFKLRDWQQDEIKKIYDNPHGTRRYILSMPRKNGKTAFSACLLNLHMVGPESKPNAQLVSTATKKEQAAVVYELAAKMIRQSPDLLSVMTCRDTRKEILSKERGTIYRALSKDAKGAHGMSPIWALHDELGQASGPVFDLFDVVETGMGAHEHPLSIIISTQAPTDNDLLSILIDDAIAGHDPRTVVTIYAAEEDADPFSDETLRKANPAYGDFLNVEEIQKTALEAKRLPSFEASYRNLHLNQRVEMDNPFISTAVWKRCSQTPKPLDGLPVYAGLDLSEVKDLTALVAIGIDDDGMHNVHPFFWLPGDELGERSRADRVPYDIWHKDGKLFTVPGRTVNYEYIAQYLFDFVMRYDVRQINFDRWNYRHLRPWLEKAGFRPDQLEGDAAIFNSFGQGYASMSPALRDTESAILNEKLRHGAHPVLNMCMGNAVVEQDPAGNRKLNKGKSRGRIDGAVALVMAQAAASTYDEPPDMGAWLGSPIMVI